MRDMLDKFGGVFHMQSYF